MFLYWGTWSMILMCILMAVTFLLLIILSISKHFKIRKNNALQASLQGIIHSDINLLSYKFHISCITNACTILMVQIYNSILCNILFKIICVIQCFIYNFSHSFTSKLFISEHPHRHMRQIFGQFSMVCFFRLVLLWTS